MTAHDQQGRPAHDRNRTLRTVGLTAALGLAVLAAVMFFVADAVATKKCLDTGYGLADRISMTEEGCELTVRAADGTTRSAVVPTLSEPLATAALATAVGSAVPPVVCLWLAARRQR